MKQATEIPETENYTGKRGYVKERPRTVTKTERIKGNTEQNKNAHK